MRWKHGLWVLLCWLPACFTVPPVDWDDDGYGDPRDGGDDCDDTDAASHPGAEELCDGADNDCDGQVDEDVPDPPQAAEVCDGADNDCDGRIDEDVEPPSQAAEVCDGADNDCDGEIDEALIEPHYADTDGDGYGDAEVMEEACPGTDGLVDNANDCDDTSADVFPGATEVCDGADNDCDQRPDEGLSTPLYADTDGDGFGDPSGPQAVCGTLDGYVDDPTDCDDGDPAIHPGVDETCDGIDEDCDHLVDEGLEVRTWYPDEDGDGAGHAGPGIDACDAPDGYLEDDSDCDDADPELHPGAEEVCDGVDNDCDFEIDEDFEVQTWHRDGDLDGFGDPSNAVDDCEAPDGYVADGTDCDDRNASSHPGATDYCDGADNDCDGRVDGGRSIRTFYADDDGDGFGNAEAPIEACYDPDDHVEDATDCDDADPEAYPGAYDVVGDDLDSNCNGLIDRVVRVAGVSWYNGDGIPATTAIIQPNSVVIDTAGNLYIADGYNHRIRKVALDGTISTYAGTGVDGFSGDGGPATEARLYRPWSLEIDASGNLYIADSLNHRIRKVAPDGSITTFAGTGAAGSSGDGGQATQAQLNEPLGLALDGTGVLYIADSINNRVRKVEQSGRITTVAGAGGSGTFSGDGGPATAARFSGVYAVAVDEAGRVFIADRGNHRVRMVDEDGIISTLAGNGTAGFAGDGGPATAAQLNRPSGLSIDASGLLYIVDTENHRIRRVDAEGNITTVAGTGSSSYSGDGGLATKAALFTPLDLSFGPDGGLYIADRDNLRIRRIDPEGVISTLAGTRLVGFEGDGGPATEARFAGPADVALDATGNLYISDVGNQRVRRVDMAGRISTWAGNGARGYDGDGGPATLALLNDPGGLAVDRDGDLYIVQYNNRVVRKVRSDGVIFTFAGTGGEPVDTTGDGLPDNLGNSGPATEAVLSSPIEVAVDEDGSVYIAEWGHRVRKVTQGYIFPFAGSGLAGSTGDGGPAIEARLNYPWGMGQDIEGNFYIVENGNHRIRKVDEAGTISTIAGTSSGFAGDSGPATAARLSRPANMAVDARGNLYVADQENQRIRRIDPDGVITTVMGTGVAGASGEGGPASAVRLNGPSGLVFAPDGRLYVADYQNQRVLAVIP